MKKTGIYMIRNTKIDNRIYIGSSSDLEARIINHANKLLKNTHENKKLQNCFNKNGNNFEWCILEECLEENLLQREQYYINDLNPYYNICKIAGRTSGYKQTQESKNKMSNSKKQLYKNGFVVWNKGISLTKEVRDRISNTLKDNYIKENHPFYGKNHTRESKILMVDANHRRLGTHHNGHKGRVFKLDKNTLEVLDVYSSAPAAAETLPIKGKVTTAGNKIGEAAKYNRCAYKFKWCFEKDLDQVKVDELLESLNKRSISSQALDTSNEGSETT